MTGEEYIAFLRARKPEVYIQNSSGVPVKWIVARAYINGVSAKRHTDAEDYSHDDTGFFPVAMLMTKEQAEKKEGRARRESKVPGENLRRVRRSLHLKGSSQSVLFRQVPERVE